MGSGKTHNAEKLSELIGWPFLDLDRYIEKKGGQSIAKLFEFGGEAQFRKIEQQALLEIIENKHEHIIATGGGTPIFFDNLEKMKSAGLVIYLDTSLDLIMNRIEHTAESRPLLKIGPGETLKNYVENLLNKRKEYYHKANIAIEVNQELDKPAETIAEYLSLIMPDKFSNADLE